MDFLSHIQAVDGIYHVVRAFDSDEVIHVDDSVDPIRDLETINHELCAKGFSGVEESHYGRGERREEIKRDEIVSAF